MTTKTVVFQLKTEQFLEIINVKASLDDWLIKEKSGLYGQVMNIESEAS